MLPLAAAASSRRLGKIWNEVDALGRVHLLLSLLVTAALSVGSAAGAGEEYGLVLDAGSTGTRVRIYRWAERSDLSKLPPDITYIDNLKVRPGISEFADRLGDIGDHLRPLLDKAKNVVPSSAYSTTPIFMMATAGLRLIDPVKGEAIFDEARKILSNKTLCPFQFSAGDARILSGEEEGMFTWISANYLIKYFGKNSPFSSSVGTMEMGGASMQIAFIPETDPLANKFEVDIPGDSQSYPLYTHSYLYYGENYIAMRVREFLASSSTNQGGRIMNPCMLKGDLLNTTVNSRAGYFQFQGSGNGTACMEVLRHYTAPAADDRCYPRPCAIGQIYQPKVPRDMVFYAIAAFVDAPTALNVISANGSITARNLQNAALTYCEKSIPLAMNMTGASTSEVSTFCLEGLYFSMLLEESFGFDPNRAQVIVDDYIDRQFIGWPMGAMVYAIKVANQKSPGDCPAANSCNPQEPLGKYYLSVLVLFLILFSMQTRQS
ncbi:probable apyrase 3 [Lingula anatina]|uniref:Probable apyrase 3 n=1 Tax=Lingula anatina TaxID=7574 RepID=A0A1S3JPJ2_LINAN|nr:probable apyrase 3 [Lingula anatina]XP_013412285.1 probable apyrase 3 [Lingula anatina]XP_013412286.1 probable apyrase 3 [Lingula anatina]|eukprot:XP_013412284.1 probable apyrase 3 [Lingula anatina]